MVKIFGIGELCYGLLCYKSFIHVRNIDTVWCLMFIVPRCICTAITHECVHLIAMGKRWQPNISHILAILCLQRILPKPKAIPWPEFWPNFFENSISFPIVFNVYVFMKKKKLKVQLNFRENYTIIHWTRTLILF